MRAATREAFGRALVELAREGLEFVVLDANVSEASRTSDFAHEFPTRFVNCGISEQSMVAVAAGYAASGIPVVAASFAAFLVSRAFDQMRMLVAQPHLDVTLVGTHGGITVGEDGISAQAVEDLALMSSLAGVTVIVPADATQTRAAMRAALTIAGPVYVRCSRFPTPASLPASEDFRVGRANLVRGGDDLTIVATGTMVEAAIAAAELLDRGGARCSVLNVSTVCPIDEEALVAAARRTGRLVVAEEHLVNGGLGSIVARVLATTCPVPMRFVGLQGTYAGSAPAEDLLRHYGLSPEAIAGAAASLLGRAGGDGGAT